MQENYTNKSQSTSPIKAQAYSNNHLEHLEESLEKLQFEFEEELDLYEQNYEKLRRLKSNLLAVDFAETFLKEDDDDIEESSEEPLLGSTAPRGANNSSSAKNNSKPGSPLGSPTQDKNGTTQSDKEMVHPPLQARQSQNNNYPYQRMQGMWEKIKTLETLLETHQQGLREKIDCIKQTELEIRNVSLYLNTSRSSTKDPKEDESRRNSFNAALQKSHELNLLLPQELQTLQTIGSNSINTNLISTPKSTTTPTTNRSPLVKDPKDLALSLNLVSKEESHPRNNLLSRTEQSEIAMSPTGDDEINVEIATGNQTPDKFQITRTSWIICIGVNVVVVLATIAILIVNATLPA